MAFLRRLGLTMLALVVACVVALFLHYHVNYHDTAVMFGSGFWFGWFLQLVFAAIWRKHPASAV